MAQPLWKYSGKVYLKSMRYFITVASTWPCSHTLERRVNTANYVFFTSSLSFSHFLCPYHVTLNLILEKAILDSHEMARTHTNSQQHLCLCIFMVIEQHVTAMSLLRSDSESWFWISHCETVLRGFNSRRRFWHIYLVERIHVHPHLHKNK